MLEPDRHVALVYDNERLVSEMLSNVLRIMDMTMSDRTLSHWPIVRRDERFRERLAKSNWEDHRVEKAGFFVVADTGGHDATNDLPSNVKAQIDLRDPLLVEAIRRAIADALRASELDLGSEASVAHLNLAFRIRGRPTIWKNDISGVWKDPKTDRAADMVAELARRNDEARERFMEAFTSLTAEEMARSRAAKADADSIRDWNRNGYLLAVDWNHERRMPLFQLHDGEPLASVAAVLRDLPDEMTDWEKAFWFVSANGELDGAAPVDLLSLDPESVVTAARARRELVFG